MTSPRRIDSNAAVERETREAAASALQWWLDAGVDTGIAEDARDWLKPEPKAEARPAIPLPAEPPSESLPPQLDLFRAWLKDSTDLPFAGPSAPRICPSGDPAAALMVLTDMPSSEDCATGLQLSGAPGRLFDAMLKAMGLERTTIYLAALSCLRAPDGRFSRDTAMRCAEIARHHIGLVRPKALLLMGDACAKALTGASMAEARGRWHVVETPAGPVDALATFSPDFLLRQPRAKAYAWADLQMAMERLNG